MVQSRLTYEPYSEYEETGVQYILGSTVLVMDDWLLAEDIVQSNDLSWTRYCIMAMCRRMKYLLMKTAIKTGVDIDKWKHDMAIVNKRKNMIVIE